MNLFLGSVPSQLTYMSLHILIVFFLNFYNFIISSDIWKGKFYYLSFVFLQNYLNYCWLFARACTFVIRCSSSLCNHAGMFISIVLDLQIHLRTVDLCILKLPIDELSFTLSFHFKLFKCHLTSFIAFSI